jgi:hypothetical protein
VDGEALPPCEFSWNCHFCPKGIVRLELRDEGKESRRSLDVSLEEYKNTIFMGNSWGSSAHLLNLETQSSSEERQLQELLTVIRNPNELLLQAVVMDIAIVIGYKKHLFLFFNQWECSHHFKYKKEKCLIN